MVEIAPWTAKQEPDAEALAAKELERTWQERLRTDPNARRREQANRAARSRSSTWMGGR